MNTRRFSRMRLALLGFLALALGACSPTAETSYPGTRAMVARLDSIAAAADPMGNSYLSRERAAFMQAQPEPEDQIQRLSHRLHLAKELLQAGQTLEAIDLFRQVQAQAGGHRLRTRPSIKEMLALAYMRQAEQENCIQRHSPDACVLPLRGDGLHRMQGGARAAVPLLEEVLAADPGNLDARWLLNIAYMALGKHPEGVPPRWLIPEAAFGAEYDIGRFANVAPRLGLDVLSLAGGAIMEDFDNDGTLDIMASSWGLRDPLRFFVNNGDGSFTERTNEAGLQGLVGGLNIVQTDYDNDGWADVYVMRGGWFGANGLHPNSLLRNRGGGRFEDVTEAAGLMTLHPTQTAAWGDFDNDGWLDLFVGNEASREHPAPCELFRNNGDGTFTEVAAAAGAAVSGFVKGVNWGDYDNDGRLDLYISRLTAPNILLHNDGPGPDGQWRFSDATEAADVAEPVVSFPTFFFDYDNDGWLDLFVSGYRADAGDVAAEYLGLPDSAVKPRLYRNRGDGGFDDVTRAAGLHRVLYTMGCNFGDLDNDGFADFYAGTGDPDLRVLIPNRMFRNAGGRFFQDVGASGGFGQLQKGHGVAFGDIDNDGDQDIYTVTGGAYSGDVYHNALYLNPGHGNRWIGLKLVGQRSNRPGIGVRLRVELTDAEGRRTVHALGGSGASFGASSLRQEIGLGPAQSLDELVVHWPASGLTQRFAGVEMDRYYIVREEAAALEEWRPRRLDLAQD